jgi:surface polysaccharide O-acyltransferase-like enzyme
MNEQEKDKIRLVLALVVLPIFVFMTIYYSWRVLINKVEEDTYLFYFFFCVTPILALLIGFHYYRRRNDPGGFED